MKNNNNGKFKGPKQSGVLSALSNGFASFADLLDSKAIESNLEAASPPRLCLTSIWSSPNDFIFEVAGELVNAPVGVTEELSDFIANWMTARRTITAVATGHLVDDNVDVQKVMDKLVSHKVIREVNHGWGFEHIVPNSLFRKAMIYMARLTMAENQRNKEIAPWDVPVSYKHPISLEMLQECIEVIEAEDVLSCLPEVKGMLQPLAAATPRPTADADDVQKNYRWCQMTRWGGTTVYKLRVEVKDGRMVILWGTPKLVSGPREKEQEVQAAARPDRYGRPGLTAIGGLVPLSDTCKFLTDTFVKRADIQQHHPEIVKWAGDGLPLKLIQNLNSHPAGAEMIKELRISMVQFVEEQEAIAAAAKAAALELQAVEADAVEVPVVQETAPVTEADMRAAQQLVRHAATMDWNITTKEAQETVHTTIARAAAHWNVSIEEARRKLNLATAEVVEVPDQPEIAEEPDAQPEVPAEQEVVDATPALAKKKAAKRKAKAAKAEVAE